MQNNFYKKDLRKVVKPKKDQDKKSLESVSQQESKEIPLTTPHKLKVKFKKLK